MIKFANPFKKQSQLDSYINERSTLESDESDALI
jgi:hypothetical protein